MAEIIPINSKWDHLTQEAVRATNIGMTYGKYKAMQYERRNRRLDAPPEQPEAEPEPVKNVHRRRKLEGKEKEIMAMLDDGESINGIARKFRVRDTTVRYECRMVGGELWKKCQQTARAYRNLGKKPKVRHD